MNVVEDACIRASLVRHMGEEGLATMTVKLGPVQNHIESKYVRCDYDLEDSGLSSTTKVSGESGTRTSGILRRQMLD